MVENQIRTSLGYKHGYKSPFSFRTCMIYANEVRVLIFDDRAEKNVLYKDTFVLLKFTVVRFVALQHLYIASAVYTRPWSRTIYS